MKHKLIMENWRRFVNESDDAGDENLKAKGEDLSKMGVVRVVDFLNSPEGKDPKVRAALDGGQNDGKPSDEVMTVNPATPTVGNLKPTQREISLMKSIGWPLASVRSVEAADSGDITGQGKRIVTSGDLVIDGHHRWSSTYAIAGAGATINATDIELPGSSADTKLAGAQLAIAATLPDDDARPIPSAHMPKDDQGNPLPSDNILGATAEQIAGMIRERIGTIVEPDKLGAPLLGEEYLQAIKNNAAGQKHFGVTPEMDSEAVTNAIINKVASNLASLPAFAQGAPERAKMPQFDGGDTHTKKDVNLGKVIDTMKSGKVNYKSNY